MVGPVRAAPPDLPVTHIARPRLLECLERRWTTRLVTVVAGPGFGKTSLLVDALAHTSRTDGRLDVWLTCEPGDSSAAALLAGIGESLGIGALDLDTLVRDIWVRAPAQVCIVLDDVNEIRDGSPGAEMLARLLAELPQNGHLVTASRSTPPFPLARLAARHQLERITEAELVFSDDELRAFAERCGIDPSRFDSTGGWPALVELTAAAGDLVEPYVWDEVLLALGAERSRQLARLVAIGAADDEVAAAAVGGVGGIATLTHGIPLVRWAGDAGAQWAELHPLWAPVLRPILADHEVDAARRAAADVHRRRGRYDRAADLFAEASAWDDLLATLREAAMRPGAFEEWHRFARWRRLLPGHLADHPVTRLAHGIEVAAHVPADAPAHFEIAEAGFRRLGDVDGELAAMQKHGLVAWWANDVLTMLTLSERARGMAAHGHRGADVVARVGQAAIAHVSEGPEEVLAQLADVDLGTAGEWAAAAAWLRTVAHRRRGDLTRARRSYEEAEEIAPGDMQLAIAEARANWLRGEVDGVTPVLQHAADHYRAARNRYLEVETTLELAARRAWLGDVAGVRALLDSMAPDLEAVQGALARVLWAISHCALAIDMNDESSASSLLAGLPEAEPGTTTSWYWLDRAALAVVHVLRPDDRDGWAAEVKSPVHQVGLDLGRLLVAVRAGDLSTLRTFVWPSAGLARAHLPASWLAELVVAAINVDNPPPADIVDALVAGGRAVGGERARRQVRTRKVADRTTELGKRTPAADGPALLGVLGPVVIERAGLVLDHPDLHRRRVRELLAVLTLGRAQRRDEIAELLWPDTSDPRHNLRVTLGYLKRALRDLDLDAVLIGDQRSVRLVPSPWLQCDLWQYESMLNTAERAEREADPERALECYGDALGLWRADPFADLADVDWVRDEQTRLRQRYVEVAIRAGQLHLAAGAADRARASGARALAADPYDESAHLLVIRALLADGDRLGARRAVDRCTTALEELGVDPSPATLELIAAVHSG